MIPRKLLAVIGILAAFTLAACGGDDGDEPLTSDEYEQEARSALEPVVNLSEFGEAARAAETPDELAAAVSDIEAQFDSTNDELSAIEPPEEVAEVHDQLIAALSDINSAFAAVGDAAEVGDRQALTDRAADLQAALPEFQSELTAAEEQFQAEEIDLGLTSGG